MKKHFLRAKQIADQTFLRAEKTDVLTDDLISGEKRVDAIKQSCQAISKKIGACMQGSGNESSVEKRRKKMPELLLSQCMEECYLALGESSVFGSVLGKSFTVQNKIAEELLNYEVAVEKTILTPVNTILDNDIPAISKLRKNLKQLTLDMDSAKARYQQAYRHAMQTTGSSTVSAISKTESLKEEMEEASMKVDQCKDALATEIFALISRESEMANVFIQWYMLQADYHSRVLAVLESSIPILEKQMKEHANRPVFGCPLEEHLHVTDRQVAWVLEVCICCLLETALNEEGLFRIAGSASKVKKLKNAFDSGILDITDYVRDPHAVAGALKLYLRELPEPLMTYALYDDWMSAATIGDPDTRLQGLWQVVHRLPEANYNNLRYIMKFLAKFVSRSEVNKMSSQNIAIVMPPNLLRDPSEDLTMPTGMNMSVANLHSSIIESLINHVDWFFPEEVEFYLTTLPLPRSPSEMALCYNREFSVSQGIDNTAFVPFNGEVEISDALQHVTYQNSVNTSPPSQSPRIVHRPGKKPAPPAPGPPKDPPPPKPSQQHSVTEHSAFERSSLEEEAPILRPKPLRQTATLPRRPEKPERPSLVHRQSHDNLYGLLEKKPSENEAPPKPEKQQRKSDPTQISPKPLIASAFSYSEPVRQQNGPEKPQLPERAFKQQNSETTSVSNLSTSSAVDVDDIALTLSPVFPSIPMDQDSPPRKSPLPLQEEVPHHQNGLLPVESKPDKWDFLTSQLPDKAPDRPPRTIPPPLQVASPVLETATPCDSTAMPKDQECTPEVPQHNSCPQPEGTPPKERRASDSPSVRLSAGAKIKPTRPQPPPPPLPPTKPKMHVSSEDTRL